MNLRITKPGTQELMDKYIGKKFRYHSKHGGTVENILCEDISICEIMNHKNGGLIIEKIEISIISDKRNVYDLNEVEFYEENN
jgi:hypothetical protein